tara:strand:- start:777 stop:1529 length:753 start_codon:yes stop_codon:yes gene_type:complete
MKNNFIKINQIRKKLKTNKPSFGTWMQIPHADIAKILTNNNFDWIALDLEHGSGSINDIPKLSFVIGDSKSAFIVRISDENFKSVGRFLDLGVEGFILSKVEDPKKIKEVIDKSNFPPEGDRGYGFSISNDFGLQDMSETLKFKPLIVAMIETVKGLKNINRIVKVKGLDAIFIGPYDLSLSLGIPGQFQNKKFQKTILNIINICKKNKIACGIHMTEPKKDDLKENLKKGFTFIAYAMDSSFLKKIKLK